MLKRKLILRADGLLFTILLCTSMFCTSLVSQDVGAVVVKQTRQDIPIEWTDVNTGNSYQWAADTTGFYPAELSNWAPHPACGASQTICVEKRICSETICVRGEDEVWTVDARNIGCEPCDLSQLHVAMLDCGQWNCSDLQTLTAAHDADPTKETFIFLHGYNTDEQWAETRGMQVYENLFQGACSRPAVRFVIFKWRSDRESFRVRRDYDEKTCRALQVGSTLAMMLDQFSNTDITVAGYSLGAQATLAAMQQPPCFGAPVDGDGYRLVLIAPALDNQFASMLAGGFVPARQADATLVFTNRKDRVIRLVERRSLLVNRNGRVTIEDVVRSCGAAGLNPFQIELSCELSGKHQVDLYTQSETLIQNVNQLLWQSSMISAMPHAPLTHGGTLGEPVIDEPVMMAPESVFGPASEAAPAHAIVPFGN